MTEGLTLTAKKLMKSFQPLSSETTVSSVAPLHKGEGKMQYIALDKIQVYSLGFSTEPQRHSVRISANE